VDIVYFAAADPAALSKSAAAAGAQLKKVNLELGSIDPFIVFKDADLDVAVPGVAWARLLNAGQVCTSSKRIYVERPIARKPWFFRTAIASPSPADSAAFDSRHSGPGRVA
jgi:acyl-CoA reductase-like NAD-dependent aldehyde dehydrogenase